MNIYSASTPQNTFYVEGKIFVGKNCCILKLGGIYSDKYSGSDTVCVQLLHWLSRTPRYCDYFFDDPLDINYSIFLDDSFSGGNFPDDYVPVPEPTL